MALQDEVAALTNGAHFLRADLHIHSFGESGSYDVKDAGMTPEAIVDAATAENLKVIAIADHNAIGNVARALKHAEGKHVLVVPAVELSTPQGHLLIYCPTLDKLQRFFGKLNLSADKKACRESMSQCLELAEPFLFSARCFFINVVINSLSDVSVDDLTGCQIAPAA